jgi:Do/DeqQ family serine protease
MKTKAFLGNIVIAILSSLIAIIIYVNFFQDEFSERAQFETQAPQSTELVGDSNQVSYQRKPLKINDEVFDFTNAAEKSIHVVVHVTSKSNLENGRSSRNPIYDLLFGDDYSQQPSISFGSGVIISEDGYIVTNYHVVEESDEIQVVLNDKRTFNAKLVGVDPGTDLALLKVESNKLPFISMGNSDELKIGEWVLAVGNPFNLTSTVTAGIVSAKARNINILRDQKYPIESYIQTDAAVNRGNSGGALVNMYGELIGINSAIISPSGSYSGYSFAIPINIAKKVVADIIKYGEVQRAVLGVTIREVTSKIAKDYKLDKIEGIYVDGVTDDGAAKKSGIKSGDVILEINNIQVNSTAQLTEQIGNFRPGELIYVTVKRDNKKKLFEVILRNMQGNTKIVKSDEFFSILGATFENVDRNDKRRLGIDNGIIISDLKNGALKKVGLKTGYIILTVQGNSINDVDDFKRELSKAGIGSTVEIEATYPGGRYIYVYHVELEENE